MQRKSVLISFQTNVSCILPAVNNTQKLPLDNLPLSNFFLAIAASKAFN